MPYVSERQRRFFNANRSKLERQGVDVDEWNRASKGKHLPETSHKPKHGGLKDVMHRMRRRKSLKAAS